MQGDKEGTPGRAGADAWVPSGLADASACGSRKQGRVRKCRFQIGEQCYLSCA